MFEIVKTIAPPEHVRATFGLRELAGTELDGIWDGGWRYGDVVLSPVGDHARAAWSGRVRETLEVDGLRVARPVRASDGRYVVSGWRGDGFLGGRPEPRYDEIVSLSVRLHAATAELARPRFLSQQVVPPFSDVDVFTVADQAAWDDDPLAQARRLGMLTELGDDRAEQLALIERLASLRRPVTVPDQLVHGDLFGTVLFDGAEAPGLLDLVPYYRPAPWAAGVVVVDALSWGGADSGLVERWAVLPEWPQMLLRALLFRLTVHALHPRATPVVYPGLAKAADLIRLSL